MVQEGYGSAAVLPEEGIYLAASIYRPVLQVLLLGLLHPSCKVLTVFNMFFSWLDSLCSSQIKLLQFCQQSIPSLGELKNIAQFFSVQYFFKNYSLISCMQNQNATLLFTSFVEKKCVNKMLLSVFSAKLSTYACSFYFILHIDIGT